MNEADATGAQEALALIVTNTGQPDKPRQARRPHSIIEVAKAIRVAEAHLGSLAALAQRIGISQEMIRRFLAAEKLHPKAKVLVRKRAIDSVDQVRSLAALPRTDQPVAADAITDGRLKWADLRALVPFRRRNPDADINLLIDRVARSSDIRVYVVTFSLTDAKRARSIQTALETHAGSGEVSVRARGQRRFGAEFTRIGLLQTRAAARVAGVPLRTFLAGIIESGANG